MKSRQPKSYSRFADIVCYITDSIPNINTMQLVKTIYFMELEYRIKFGDEQLTELPIVRIKMGPVPSGYASCLKKIANEGFISIKPRGMGKAFTCDRREYNFTLIELEVFDSVIDRIIRVREKYGYKATEKIKAHSYKTFPMQRLLEQEDKDGQFHYGYKVFRYPFFTKDDVDPLAEHRRIYREHLKKSRRFSEEDAKIDIEVMRDFKPYLEATNRIA